MREANGSFDSCNSCTQLRASVYMSYTSQIFRSFHLLSNLFVLNFIFFLLMYPGSLPDLQSHGQRRHLPLPSLPGRPWLLPQCRVTPGARCARIPAAGLLVSCRPVPPPPRSGEPERTQRSRPHRRAGRIERAPSRRTGGTPGSNAALLGPGLCWPTAPSRQSWSAILVGNFVELGLNLRRSFKYAVLNTFIRAARRCFCLTSFSIDITEQWTLELAGGSNKRRFVEARLITAAFVSSSYDKEEILPTSKFKGGAGRGTRTPDT